MIRKGFSEILGKLEQEGRHRLVAKVPQWAGVEGILIPGTLAVEQCSSAAAAQYKASLAPKGIIADLTSGLGVDVWAFARKAGVSLVYYNDSNAALCSAAKENLRLLGLENIEFSSLDAEDRLGSLGKVDMIFIDPARRSRTGTKVFRLEDCSPNLLELLPKMWEHTDTIMAKLSPMADISLITKQLPDIAEVHITGTTLECKELLCILRKGWDRPWTLTVAQMAKDSADTVVFKQPWTGCIPIAQTIEPGDSILEPFPALSKSGLFGEICNTFQLNQLDKSTHLFSLKKGSELAEGIGKFFKRYEVMEIADFNKRSFKELGSRFPAADVSARNIPVKSEELKKKMGISGSGDVHIFGISVNSRRILVICRQSYCT